MYVHSRLLSAYFATCAVGILVSDEGNTTHLDASKGSGQDAVVWMGARPRTIAQVAAMARRGWGGKSCIDFTGRLVDLFDDAFAKEIVKAQQSKVCVKHWVSDPCHLVLRNIFSRTVFKAAWSLASMPLDFVSRIMMGVTEPIVENSFAPLLAKPLDDMVTKVQKFIRDGESDFVQYEEMYNERMKSVEKERLGAVTYLNDHITDICTGLGLKLDPEDRENVGKLIKNAQGKAKAT